STDAGHRRCVFCSIQAPAKGRGLRTRLLVWLGVGIAILSCASTAASAGEGAVRFAEDTAEDFRSCVRATVEKAAWCSRSPTARCTTRPPSFLSETFFGYSPIGSRSAAHPRTLEASLIVRWAGTHSAMSPSCSPFRPLAVQSRCAVEENLWAKRDSVVILLGRAFPSAGAQEARS